MAQGRDGSKHNYTVRAPRGIWGRVSFSLNRVIKWDIFAKSGHKIGYFDNFGTKCQIVPTQSVIPVALLRGFTRNPCPFPVKTCPQGLPWQASYFQNCQF